ncbi:unnamed protein product, partial [Meganyctiphanes norvegica]
GGGDDDSDDDVDGDDDGDSGDSEDEYPDWSFVPGESGSGSGDWGSGDWGSGDWDYEPYPDLRPVWPVPGVSCPSISSVNESNPECRFRCQNDYQCDKPFTLCCPNGCGKVCVPYNLTELGSCGCQTLIYAEIERYGNTRNISKILNFAWTLMQDRISPSSSLNLVMGHRYWSWVTVIGQEIKTPCELEDALNRVIDPYNRPLKVVDYSPFSASTRT